MGKNLSCLRKRNTNSKNSSNKKLPKKIAKKHTFVPVDLLPFEGEEKGAVFYDTRGEAIGNKGDYTLNKCRVTTSGWLVLPTVSPDQIPTKDDSLEIFAPDYASDTDDVDHDMPNCSPDEGVDMDCNTPSQSTQQSSSPMKFSQESDQGLGSISSTPADMLSQNSQGVETSTQPPSESASSELMDVMESAAGLGSEENPIPEAMDAVNNLSDVPPITLRRSMRQSQRFQEEPSVNAEDENNNTTMNEPEMVVMKKAIQKKNTCSLPVKLRNTGNGNSNVLEPIDEFCARTFFCVDIKNIKNFCQLESSALKVNKEMMEKFMEIYEKLKATTRKNKKPGEIDEDDSCLIDIETLNEPESDPDAGMMPVPVEQEDIIINNDVDALQLPESLPPSRDISQTDPPPPPVDDLPDVHHDDGDSESEIVDKDMDYIGNHKDLERNAEISARVKEWQDKLTPYLEEVDRREEFDINYYGSQILNSFDAFEDGKQGRQTKTFREFCKGMQKWQIHRYFMALLPLANIGNVQLETEQAPDGQEEILITLLSRQMHHLRLEDFNKDEEDINEPSTSSGATSRKKGSKKKRNS